MGVSLRSSSESSPIAPKQADAKDALAGFEWDRDHFRLSAPIEGAIEGADAGFVDHGAAVVVEGEHDHRPFVWLAAGADVLAADGEVELQPRDFAAVDGEALEGMGGEAGLLVGEGDEVAAVGRGRGIVDEFQLALVVPARGLGLFGLF